MTIDTSSESGSWQREIDSRPKVEAFSSSPVDTIRATLTLGKMESGRMLDHISMRLIEFTVPPGASLKQVERLLLSAMSNALRQCHQEVRPHAQES